MALSLKRKRGEQVILYAGEHRIVVEVDRHTKDSVKLRFDAPPEVRIVRRELEEQEATK